tara:strand:- start:351 stop:608 length:258 start_codon:yes stop_codon:yes gene_type:complete
MCKKGSVGAETFFVSKQCWLISSLHWALQSDCVLEQRHDNSFPRAEGHFLHLVDLLDHVLGEPDFNGFETLVAAAFTRRCLSVLA